MIGGAALRVAVVVAVMAGSLAMAPPSAEKLKALAGMMKMEQQMAQQRSADWAVNLTTTEIIETFGYPTEIHHVTTPDGYILELHRVPHGINDTSGNRPVAFVQHCLLCSSSDYIMNTPDQALGQGGNEEGARGRGHK